VLLRCWIPLLLLLCLASLAVRAQVVGHLEVVTPTLQLPGLARPASLRILLPAGYVEGQQRYPVIYLFDGQNLFDAATSYAGEWGADETLDALRVEHGFEAIVVGIDHGGVQRASELSAWPIRELGEGRFGAVLADLVGEIKPWIDARYRTRPARDSTAIGGSSLGGLAALYAIHQRPDTFSRALVFSPSLWVSEQSFMHVGSVTLPANARVYLYIGTHESDSGVADVTRLHHLFVERPLGAKSTLDVVEGGAHNESAWREALPRALRWLFELEE
jgi:predicted alpha/beta superfamily hydrolase